MKFRSFALSALLVAFASPRRPRRRRPHRRAKVWEDKLRRMAPPAPAAAPMGGGALAISPQGVIRFGFEFSDATAEGSLGTTEMRKANRVAAEILQRRMEETRPNDF